MGKNARDRDRRNLANVPNFWESKQYNDMAVQMYTADLVKLATNRFKWDGLPDTVNVKYLEFCLLMNGYATIARPKDKGLENAWFGLQVANLGDLSPYGEPTDWMAMGANGKTWFPVKEGDNGVLIYNSNQFVNAYVPGYDSTWIMIQYLARKLAHFDRTEDTNLAMQQTAWFLTCGQEKRLDAINLFKQINGYEPAVIASDSVRSEIGIDVLKTDVPYIGEQLANGKRNIMNQAYAQLGIPHLEFEKSERMISDEAQSNNSPTMLRLLDALTPRRRAAERLSELTGSEITVTLNHDLETEIYDYENGLGLILTEAGASEEATEAADEATPKADDKNGR